MDMVLDPVDLECGPARLANNSAQKRMQLIFPTRADQPSSFLRSANNVIEKIRVRH